MMQRPPPQYSSQAQFSSPGAQGYYPAQSAQPIPSQPFALYQQQQQYHGAQGCLWKCLCCFRGNNSSYLRTTSVVLGGIVLIHAFIVLVVAAVAMSENPAAEVTDPHIPGITRVVNKAPTLDFYQILVSLPKGEAIRKGKIAGGIFGAFLITIIDEVLPGACLIAGALLLKDILCRVSVWTFGISFLLNGVDIPLLAFGSLLVAIAPVDCTNCDKQTFFLSIIGGILMRFIGCCYVIFCIIVASGLKQQIRNGVYGMRLQPPLMPPPMTYSATAGQTGIGEQTNSAAEATRPKEEPMVENT